MENKFLFLDYILLWFPPLLEAVSFLSILNMNMNENHLQIFSGASYHTYHDSQRRSNDSVRVKLHNFELIYR